MAAKKTTAAKSAAEKAVPVKQSTTKKATAAKQSTAKKTVAKKAPVKKTPVKKTPAAGTVKAGRLAVREGEKAWTASEIAGVRETLDFDAARLHAEIVSAEQEIDQLLREGGEGAGNDQADVGSNTFERDHEMSMAKNARQQLLLVEQAVTRIDAGTYGVCESCERPIGKMRLQAFPRATLCLECKQRQERR